MSQDLLAELLFRSEPPGLLPLMQGVHQMLRRFMVLSFEETQALRVLERQERPDTHAARTDLQQWRTAVLLGAMLIETVVRDQDLATAMFTRLVPEHKRAKAHTELVNLIERYLRGLPKHGLPPMDLHGFVCQARGAYRVLGTTQALKRD